MIPGHGEPFTDFAGALDRAFKRTDAFEADPRRFARHAVRVVLAFALLERQRLSLADLPAYVERVPIYAEFNARWFGLAPADFVHMLVGDLERAGAIKRSGDFIVPA